MPEPFEVRESWRDVSQLELEAFLRKYPRPLEERPPLTQRKTNFRQWMDVTLGNWPHNVVAKTWRRGSCTGYQIRSCSLQ